jgi:hypothetical protein
LIRVLLGCAAGTSISFGPVQKQEAVAKDRDNFLAAAGVGVFADGRVKAGDPDRR